MKKKLLGLSIVTALSIGFAGCGSSDSSTATTAATTGTGYYVDSAVSGVNYVCGDQNGTTDTEGMFKFAVGKDCTFKLGNIVLKSIAADKLIDKATIVEDNVSVAAFLQTVDVDGNASNGIQVTSEVVEAVTTALVDTTEVPVAEKLDSVFTALKNDVTGYSGKVVSETEAAEHLEKTYEAVTKDLLAGKTYYVVHISSAEHFVGKVSFNDEVTTETWTGLINDTDSETETVKLEGNKLIWTSDNSYSKVIGENSAGYLLVADYNGDDSSDGKSYLFTTQREAEAFYYTKYPTTTGSLDLSGYNSIAIIHNASSAVTDGIIAQNPGQAQSISANASCSDFGFSSTPISTVTTNGAVTKVYMNSDQTRICDETDYANSTVAVFPGTNDVIVYLNQQLSTGGSTTTSSSSSTGGTTGSTSTSVTLQPIVQYTQSMTGPASPAGGTMTKEMGADGQLAVIKQGLYVDLTLASGLDNLTITQMIEETEMSGDFPNEGLSHVKITRNYANGEEHIVVTSAKYGSDDCVNTYSTPLPLTITSQSVDIPDGFDDSSLINTTCQDWVNNDSSSTDMPTSFEAVKNTTITSASGAMSHLSRHMQLN